MRIIVLIFIFLGVLKNDVKSQDRISINQDLELKTLSDSVFVYTSFFTDPKFGRFGSNGLLLIANGEALMIDTPMEVEQTKILVDYLKDSMNVTLTSFIGGHYHNDCIGGLSYLNTLGVKSLVGSLTYGFCDSLYLSMPTAYFKDSSHFYFHEIPVYCVFLGAGHTPDNILVYIPSYKILFGGCMVKSVESKGLGNIREANLVEWKQTLQKVSITFPDANIVIPGHGDFGSMVLVNHTLNLLDQQLSVKVE